MHATRNRVNLIERPPFYHLPRSRPVSFERPTHLRCENKCGQQLFAGSQRSFAKVGSSSSQQQQQQTSAATKMSSSQGSSFISYNSSPKPFSRQSQQQQSTLADQRQSCGCQCPQKHQQAEIPKIMVNDQSVYPTSTVHKSLYNSLRQSAATGSAAASVETATSKQRDENHQQVHYSRLISPTQSTTTSCDLASSAMGQQYCDERSTDISRDRASTAEAAHHHQQQVNFGERQQVNFGERDTNKGQIARRELIYFKPPPTSTAILGHQHDSNVVKPDSKRDEFMFTRQLERASIAHQTYRTLPIVMPKPKARHDLASGTYMSLNQDPTWELTHMRPSSANSANNERRIRQAMTGEQQPEMFKDAYAMQSGQFVDSTVVPIFNYREYIDSTRRGY